MNLYLVNYTELTSAQSEHLNRLTLLPAQQRYVGTIESSLYTLATVQSAEICGLALLLEGMPEAFMLLRRGVLLPPWAQADAAVLQALQVSWRQQRRGLGRFFLAELPKSVSELWPEVRCLQLSVDPNNEVALRLYRALGWIDTGQAFRAEVGFERQMTLML